MAVLIFLNYNTIIYIKTDKICIRYNIYNISAQVELIDAKDSNHKQTYKRRSEIVSPSVLRRAMCAAECVLTRESWMRRILTA